jgi:TrmH family RNA methyltransferase
MNSLITSRQHPLCKTVRALHSAAGRKKHGLFLAEGGNAVASALRARWALRELLVTPDDEGREWSDLARESGIETRFVAHEILEYLGEAQTSPGVLALAQLPAQWKARASPIETPTFGDGLTLVLDGIGDPGNVGTLLRSADAAGASSALLMPDSADPFGSKAVRASAGSVFHLPLHMSTHAGAQDDVARPDVPLVVAVARDGEDCFSCSWPLQCALVLGHETRGVSPEMESAATMRVTIPMSGRAESLNVAAAGAILLFAWRQATRRAL